MLNLLDEVLEIEAPLTESETDILYPEDSPESSPESDEPDPDNPQADPDPEERKLSDLIRQGAVMHPQSLSFFWHVDDDGAPTSCAPGAALNARIGDKGMHALRDGNHSFYDSLIAIASATLNKSVGHPTYGYPASVYFCVTTLNDHAKWSREDIADWLESIGL